MVWSLIGSELPQAVGVALSPMPIVLVMLMLVSARAKTNGPAYALGWAVGIFGLAYVSFLLADGADVGADEAASDGGSIVQIVLGVLLLWFAWRQWSKRPAAGEDPGLPKWFAQVDTMSPLLALGLGVLFATVNAKNTALGISVGVQAAQAGASGATAVAAIAVYTLIAASTVVVPVLAVLVLGERVAEPLDSAREWLIHNNATIMGVLFGVLGAKVLGAGLGVLG